MCAMVIIMKMMKSAMQPAMLMRNKIMMVLSLIMLVPEARPVMRKQTI